MDEFVSQYGLLAVYLGMWLEGETVLVISGFLAHQNVFHFSTLIPVAALGAMSIDHVVFFCGRTMGGRPFFQRWIGRHPGTASRFARLGNSWPGFFGLRFVYGTRAPSLFLLGSQGMGWASFIVREVPAVAIWCAIWSVFGHAIGNVIVLLHGEIHRHHRPWIVLVMAVAGLTTAGLVTMVQRRRGRPESAAK